ncbi:MAG: serine hydrolase domain-containing protein [Bacteroidia bacterium]
MKPNKRIRTVILPMLAILYTIGITSGCELLREKPLEDAIQIELENAGDRGLDGIIVCVNQSGETRLYADGWKNRENKVPADSHALFKIASISKLYIAVAATKLVAKQSLSLEQTLAELIPELVGRIEHADKITLRMMLQHRSGIPNFTDHSDFPWSDLPNENSEALKFVLDEPADFKPDKRYKYSNTNYLLIGEILDKTLGYSHHEYIKQEILIPLELHNTYSLLSEVNIDDVMSGYHIGWESDVKNNDYIHPGGSMIATAEDVGIFLRALIDGSLLTTDEQAIYSSIYEYEHTGLLPGYQSIARYHREIDAVVVQFVNTSGGLAWSKSEKIYRRIVKVLEKEN